MRNRRPGTTKSNIAFVAIVAIIIAAGYMFVSFGLPFTSPTSPANGHAATFYSSVSPQGLQLEITLNTTAVSRGEPIQAKVSLVNTLARSVSLQVNPSAYAAIDSWDRSESACGLSQVAHVFGFALFEGHYVSSNVSEAGQPVMLAPPVGVFCPNPYYSQSYVQNVEFSPRSDTATLSANDSYSSDFKPQTLMMQLDAFTGGCSTSTYEVVGGTEVSGGTTSTYGHSTHLTYSCGGGSALDGYWTLPANGTGVFIDSTSNETITRGLKSLYNNYFSQFQALPYTIEAKDVWNQTAFAYFSVRGISLEGFGLCSANCVYPAPHLGGLIFFNGPAPLKSLDLSVNGTDQGTQSWSGTTLTSFALDYKGGFVNPLVVRGDTYVLRFVATFEDNSTASATTTVVAS